MNRPVTIALADDHALVREGLRALLAAEPGFEVVGEASDGLQVLPMVERLRPRVLILDLMMPGLGGFDASREVTKRFPDTRVIILSMHAAEGYVVEALRNGASAYVPKDAGVSEVVRAVHEVVAGRRYLGRPFSSDALAEYMARARESRRDPYETLSPREREVLHLVGEGMSNQEIARRLFISQRTAETHAAKILRKLGLSSRTELVRYAVERGLREPGESLRGTKIP